MTSGMRLSEEEIHKIISSFGFFFLELYIDKKSKKRIVFKNKHGMKADVYLRYLLDSGSSIRFIHQSNPYSLENISIWLKLNNKSFELSSNNFYVRSNLDLLFHCNVCDDDFKCSWNHVQQNRGCAKCDGRQVGKYNNLKYIRPDLAREWDKSNFFKPENITKGSHKRIFWKCPNCDFVYPCSISDRILKDCGCPQCRESKGEKEISKFLIKNKIDFKIQHRFSDCKDVNELRFDFFLFGFPSKVCIEYDGEFHYRDIFNEPENFKKAKRRDKIKNKYCKNNNIYLLRIPYWEFLNIEKILTEKLLKSFYS